MENMTSSTTANSPYSQMKIADFSELEECEERAKCPQCTKSRKYFCYTCFCPLTRLQKYTPNVKLPVKIDVIKHPLEKPGKSTACHAVIISPQDVNIYIFPEIPDYDKDTTLVVFPGPDSVQLQDCVLHPEHETGDIGASRCHKGCTKLSENASQGINAGPTSDEESSKDEVHSDCREHHNKNKILVRRPAFNKVIFIDCTWNQTNSIAHDERLQGIRKVELKQWKSNFWRTQKGKPDTYLATIEAIFYFVQDYHALFVGTPDEGQYDNLLFFFAFFYQKIQKIHKLKEEKRLKNGDV